MERRQKGFSAIELLVAVAIIGVVLTMALIQWTSIMPNAKANSAVDQLLYRLRSAREQAIAHRRNVQVQFVGTNQLTISELWLAGTPPPPVTYTFEGGAQFMLIAGVPDTPMGFGNSAAVYFENLSGGPPIMQFTTNGSFIDGGNTFVNGTVFVGISGVKQSARAVTILGATGRVREYRYDGTQWQE
ncbi:MAG TPA: type II secretion system protein [Candidatus Angelobacter sp.]|nr:type II secretion system protein [Candidatus Angelobacter sp.]